MVPTVNESQPLFADRLGIASPEGYRVLYNHPTQSATTVDGWKSALFGFPFLAIGIGIALRVAYATRPAGHRHDPVWLILFMVGAFGLGGSFFIAHGLRGVVATSSYKRHAAERPGEPWLYDYHWHREGITFSAFDDMFKRLATALIFTIFLAPFAWIGLTVRGAFPFLVFSVIFGLASLFFWYRWATMLLDFLRYGNSFLSFGSFPFSLGGTLNAQLRVARHAADIGELNLTLRCVQEKYVETRDAENRTTTQVVCYELYKDSITLGTDSPAAISEGGIPISFRIPTDQPTTTLASHPPTYWEIEANGKARGADYQAFFLVPVYKS